MRKISIIVLFVCYFGILFLFDYKDVNALGQQRLDFPEYIFYRGNTELVRGTPTTSLYGEHGYFNLTNASFVIDTNSKYTLFFGNGNVPLVENNNYYLYFYFFTRRDAVPSSITLNNSISIPVDCGVNPYTIDHEYMENLLTFSYSCTAHFDSNLLSPSYSLKNIRFNFNNSNNLLRIWLYLDVNMFYSPDPVDEILALLKDLNKEGLDDSVIQQPDSGSYDDYSSSEGSLKGSMSSGADFSNVNVNIDSGTNNFIWDTVTNLAKSNSLVFGLIISTLSIGIIKLVFAR